MIYGRSASIRALEPLEELEIGGLCAPVGRAVRDILASVQNMSSLILQDRGGFLTSTNQLSGNVFMVLVRDHQGCRHLTLAVPTHEPHTAARLRKLAHIAPRAHVDGPGFPPTDTMRPHQCQIRALTRPLWPCTQNTCVIIKVPSRPWHVQHESVRNRNMDQENC